jgi:hypothetical protein
MYTLASEHNGTRKASTCGILLMYALVTSIVPLLHNDDCTAAHGTTPAGTSIPCGGVCPACTFLAQPGTAETCGDSGLVLTPSEIGSECPRDPRVLVAHACIGSIILRGPPGVLLY